ncbi:UNVERIFIED_CONTAM: LRR repeats and ubiquitin-like domain-containing protein [Sesamum calycinum]|uniref:LRR repeats and ubiquitin-like domain-containing protein n=1 Tax=Sesamum calycinum TaxID=2727403 RepID=A0AAW2S9G9_9LAMI
MDQQDAKQDASILKLNIKFSGRSIPVEIGADSTIKDLKSLLQPLTNVLPRGQKLIFKGKVLSDELRLASSGISDGAKIMIMASQGLHQGFEGWESFDERRRLKHQKQLDFRVTGSSEFDEGADRNWYLEAAKVSRAACTPGILDAHSATQLLNSADQQPSPTDAGLPQS